MRNVKRWTAGWRGLAVCLLALSAFTACGGDDGVQIDPAVAPFVGDWTASEFVVTSVANPDVSPDLIELGATFTLNVQPSGQYTAILIYGGEALTEIGRISVSGTNLTLQRDFPASSTTSGTFSFQGNSRFMLDGDTEFDFNLDGTPEPAVAHIVFGKS